MQSHLQPDPVFPRPIEKMSDGRNSPFSSPRLPEPVPLPVPAVGGVKRPAPSLLPPFEPLSSSPSLPRPTKRVARFPPSEYEKETQKYPTPVPTSSTGILSSSPPQIPSTCRRVLVRTVSTLSERAPLSAVPSIELDRHGQPTLMGRSSNSSHYQLSTNKLISRVHVRAVYLAASPPEPQKILIECMGWNGLKIHCQGRAWELCKGDSFTSETGDADIMIDVQDTRVLLQWPKPEQRISTPIDSDSPWEEERRLNAIRALSESPLRRQQRLHSPVSPSPAVNAIHTSSNFPNSSPPMSVKVYEDDESEGDDPTAAAAAAAEATQSTQVASQPLGSSLQESQLLGASLQESQSLRSSLRESQTSNNAESRDFSDRDEENDPVIHSFGPFGANLLPRMQSFTTNSPNHRSPLRPIKEATISPPKHRGGSDSTRDDNSNPVANHVINQLAFSRLSSTPMSTLIDHLPSHLKESSPGSKAKFTPNSLKRLLDGAGCVGEVQREGKDAAGKKLESEYYYIPDLDEDMKRKDAVVDGLGKRGLRACRKQHKVCRLVLGTAWHTCRKSITADSYLKAILLA